MHAKNYSRRTRSTASHIWAPSWCPSRAPDRPPTDQMGFYSHECRSVGPPGGTTGEGGRTPGAIRCPGPPGRLFCADIPAIILYINLYFTSTTGLKPHSTAPQRGIMGPSRVITAYIPVQEGAPAALTIGRALVVHQGLYLDRRRVESRRLSNHLCRALCGPHGRTTLSPRPLAVSGHPVRDARRNT